jgi:DNA-directed RNA polymerase specialized sigma24 family protein
LQAARDRCLSERERELFDLLLTDLTHQDIARLLGRRQGAIRTAHWRLVGKLRECLTGLTQAKEGADAAL